MHNPPLSPEERDALRVEIADANGFERYKRYSESAAAELIGMHQQTLKQLRLQGRISFLRLSPRNISYLGIHIADFYIEAIEWQNPKARSTVSGKSGLQDAAAPTPSIDIGGTQSVDAQDALRLAQQSLKKPSRD